MDLLTGSNAEDGSSSRMRGADARPRAVARAALRVLSLGVAMAAVLVAAAERPARADLVAAYLSGYGGVSSPQGNDGPGPGGMSTAASAGTAGGFGLQAGARLLIFEAYGDHTMFGGGASVSRGIMGLRGGIGLGGFRLILRGGGGVIDERGGALVGRGDGVYERLGGVIRGGAALERQIAPMVLGGLGMEVEAFDITAVHTGDLATSLFKDRISGGDIFFSLHLKFEIGI